LREELLKLGVYVHRILINDVVFKNSVGHGLRKAEKRRVVQVFEVWPQIIPLNRHQKTLNFLRLGLLLLRLIWALPFSGKFEYLLISTVVVFLFLRSYLAKY
jgi:hypothetical protein